MPEVVIGQCHGGWLPAEGYVAIPSSTKLFLFQDPGAKLAAAVADWGANSTADNLRSIQDSAQWTLEADDIVYDFGTEDLGPNDKNYFTGAMDGVVVVGGGGAHLSDILRTHKGNNIYWFACQAFDGKHDPTQEIRHMMQMGRIKTEANGFVDKGEVVCEFMTDAELDELLGTPRPKTLADIEKSDYWKRIFESWIKLQSSDVQSAYSEYLSDPKGKARDRLKEAGPNGDLRADFYEAVGKVKDEIR